MFNANVIRVGDIGRWTQLQSGHKLLFTSYKPRTIRVTVRASAEVFWACERVTDDGEVVQEFLTVTPAGISTVEVAVDKSGLTMIPDFNEADHVYFSAPEYEPFDLEAADAGESFLRIAHRRERNPQVEYMEFLMNQNMEARLRTMDEEIARRLSALPAKENDDDGNGVHERPAPERKKLPKDGGGKAGGEKPGSVPVGSRREPDGNGGGAPHGGGAEGGDEPDGDGE